MEAIEALALVGGQVDKELLIRNEYLAAENRILKSKLKKPVQFNNSERIQLAKIGKRMGLKALKEISCMLTGDNSKMVQKVGSKEIRWIFLSKDIWQTPNKF